MTLARKMYEAYNAGGSDPNFVNKNFRGDPCPSWDDLPANVREKWVAAAGEYEPAQDKLLPQPPPTNVTGDVWAEIIEKEPEGQLRDLMVARREQGIAKYGRPLGRDNGRDHTKDALQEALDGIVYARAADNFVIEMFFRHAACCILDMPMIRDFGWALSVLKTGRKVRRAVWNGKGMWLALTRGTQIGASQARAGAAQHLADEITGHGILRTEGPITICSHIDMRAADGSLVIGWLASQTDMLATDWEVIE